MINYLLCFVLLFASVCLASYRKTFLSASFVAVFVWFLCSLVFLYMAPNYGISSISINTFFVVLGGLTSLFLGEEISLSFFGRKKTSALFGKPQILSANFEKGEFCRSSAIGFSCSENQRGNQIVFRSSVIWLILGLEMAIFFVALYCDYRIVVQYNGSFPKSISTAYGILRTAKNSGYAWPWIVSRFYDAIYIISLISFFPLVFNFFNRTFSKRDLFCAVPTLFFCLISVLSSGRTGLEKVFCCLVMFSAVSIWGNSSLSLWGKWKKLFLIGGISFFCFGVIFIVLGVLRNGTDLSKGSSSLAYYFSSSIGALDHYVQYPFANSSGLVGVNTFSSLYSLFAKILPVNYTIYMPLEMVSLNGFLTNIYTPFRRYIQDFGAFGLVVFPLLTGLFYGFIEQKNREKANSLFWNLAISFLFYPIFEYSIEERFFNEYLSFGTAFKAAVFVATYYLFIYKRLLFTLTEKPLASVAPFNSEGTTSKSGQSSLALKLKRADICACYTAFNPDVVSLKKSIVQIYDQVGAIYIFDDGSKEKWWANGFLDCFDKVIIFSDGENKGIAHRLNDALLIGAKMKYLWVLLLDQDSVFPLGGVGMMIDWLNEKGSNRVGIVCPTINYQNVHHCFSDITMDSRPISSCITSGSLVRVNAFLNCGGFDEKMFIDYVDFDFDKTLIENGYSIICLDYLVLNHDLGGAKCIYLPILNRYHLFVRKEGDRLYYVTRNSLYFRKKHFRGFKLFLSISAMFAKIFIGSFAYPHKKEYFKTVGLGIHDCQKEIMGKKK